MIPVRISARLQFAVIQLHRSFHRHRNKLKFTHRRGCVSVCVCVVWYLKEFSVKLTSLTSHLSLAGSKTHQNKHASGAAPDRFDADRV